jgi:hypothetical protein
VPRSATLFALPHIAELIDNGGQITIGALRPITCAAIANDEDSCYAMLQRREGETLPQLLERLDAALEHAWNTDEFIDELNAPSPRSTRR